MPYYEDKLHRLRRMFGTDDIAVSDERLTVAGVSYPIVADVVVVLDPSQHTEFVRKSLSAPTTPGSEKTASYSRSVQSSFGDQWTQYSEILDEHRAEFDLYFDLLDVASLKTERVCDLGCGTGRWSFFLQEYCEELILVDFSDAIFVARRNLAGNNKAIFVMCDIKRLPFSGDFCDFLFSLGVLHHMPTDALDEVRALKKYARRNLIYLYYALDNRPFHFRWLYHAMELGRRLVSSLRNAWVRQAVVWTITIFVYLPFIALGKLLRPLGLEKQVPLYEFYNNKSIQRIRQDVHDRFCTPIEHRYTREQIMELSDTYAEVLISSKLPYWHFLCTR